MYALIMLQESSHKESMWQLVVCRLFTTAWCEHTNDIQSSRLTLLGVYPTESLAKMVKRRIPQACRTADDVISFMRERTPRQRMTKKEARRTQDSIKAALDIIDDREERRNIMPF